MKIPNNIDYDRYQWENAIDRWIFNEEHRAMLKRKGFVDFDLAKLTTLYRVVFLLQKIFIFFIKKY